MYNTYNSVNDTWQDLEHLNPKIFSQDDYEDILFTVCQGLRKYHGNVTPECTVLRSEEITLNGKTGEESTVHIPRMSIAYIRTETGTATGVAFCSVLDNPNSWYGKSLALKRAVLALLGRNAHEENIIREDTFFADFIKERDMRVPFMKSFFVQDVADFYIVPPRKEKVKNTVPMWTEESL